MDSARDSRSERGVHPIRRGLEGFTCRCGVASNDVEVLERVIHRYAEAAKMGDIPGRDTERWGFRDGENEEVTCLDSPLAVPRFRFESGTRQRRIAIEGDDIAARAQQLREPFLEKRAFLSDRQ